MAIFLPGPMIAEARGSVGGTVFSRNRAGAYTRNRSVPVNPGSTGQDQVRIALSAANVFWVEVLDDEQRDLWDDYAFNVPKTNKVGQSFNATGQNWFVGSWVNRFRAGLQPVLDAPTMFDRGPTDDTIAIEANVTNQQLIITFDDTMDWADTDGAALIVQAGRPVNGTVNYYKGPFSHYYTIEGDSTTPPTSPDTNAPTLAMSADQKFFARVMIAHADGRFTTANIVSSIAS